MRIIVSLLKKHLPYLIGAALVLVNVGIDQNVITLSAHATDVVNAVLAALGLGMLHKRQA